MSIKTRAVNLLSKFIVISGISKLLRCFNKSPKVIYYHGIENTIIDQYIQGVQISSETFKSNLKFIKKNYQVISITEFYERFKSNTFNGDEVVITFDDGYKNNLTVAAPILKELRMPFTVFLSTNLIDNTELRFPTFIIRSVVMETKKSQLVIKTLGNKTYTLEDLEYRRKTSQELISCAKKLSNEQVNLILEELLGNLSSQEVDVIFKTYESDKSMNWEDAKLLLQYGCTLASHCEDHFICHEAQDEKEMYKQLLNSRNKIKDIQGHCDFFAYPNGTNCELARNLVIKAGYKMAFTTKMGSIDKSSDISAINRVPVPLDNNRFIFRMSI